MTYELQFLPSARKEWDKLQRPIQEQFKKKLAERLEHPRVPAAALKDLPDCYKIKLQRPGLRLIYKVQDYKVTLLVVTVGKRDKSAVYVAAAARLDELD